MSWFQEIARANRQRNPEDLTPDGPPMIRHQFTGGWPCGIEPLPAPDAGGGVSIPECGFWPRKGLLLTTFHSAPCRSRVYSTCIVPGPCLARNSTCAVAWSPLMDICFTSRSMTDMFSPATPLKCLSMPARMASCSFACFLHPAANANSKIMVQVQKRRFMPLSSRVSSTYILPCFRHNKAPKVAGAKRRV